MSKLQDLIRAINEEEAEKVVSLQLNPTERSLFDFVYKNKYIPDADPKDALDISDAHYRKAASTLFGKIMDKIPPEGESYGWARWLSKKKQHKILEQELRKRISRLEKQGEEEEIANLVLTTSEFFLGSDLSNDYKPYLSEMREKVALARGKSAPWNLITLDAQFLFYECILYREKPIDSMEVFLEDIKAFNRKLDQLEKEAGQYNEPVSTYWVHYTRARLLELTEDDPAREIEENRKCIQVYENHPEKFTRRYLLNPTNNIGLIYYRESKFEDAYQIIKGSFERFPEDMATAWFLTDILAQICITTNRTDEAETLLLNYHGLKQGEATDYFEAQFGLGTVLALIDLLKGRLEDAFAKIQVAKRGLQKSNFYSLDALLRFVENSLFLLENDYDMAMEQTKKNLKFHQYHNEHPLSADFVAAHRMIPKLIKCHFDGQDLSDEDLKSIEGFQKGDLAFAGKLLEKLVSNYTTDNQNL